VANGIKSNVAIHSPHGCSAVARRLPGRLLLSAPVRARTRTHTHTHALAGTRLIAIVRIYRRDGATLRGKLPILIARDAHFTEARRHCACYTCTRLLSLSLSLL